MDNAQQQAIERRANVLFVDDERRVLTSMKALFRRTYNVFLANSGEEALELLDEEDIDVIVSDQRMPGMSGVEVLRAFKNHAPRAMRILLTGYADKDAIEASINEGEVFRYLTKPCHADTLKDTVALAVDAAGFAPMPAQTAFDPVPELFVVETGPEDLDSTTTVIEPDSVLAGHPESGTVVELELAFENDAAMEEAAEHAADFESERVTEAVTDGVTEAVTDRVTEAVTDRVTEAVTEGVTEAVTDGVTEAVTDGVTEAVTEGVTEAVTDGVTEAVTEGVTEAVTDRVTEAVTDGVTEAVTDRAATETASFAPEPVESLEPEEPEPHRLVRPNLRKLESKDVEILVLTSDWTLSETLHSALDASHTVHIASDVNNAISLLEQHAIGVLITDIAINADEIQSLTSELKQKVPELVTIVASDHSDAHRLIELINGGQVFRFLLKPIKPQQTCIWIESAVGKHINLVKHPTLLARHVVTQPARSLKGFGDDLLRGITSRIMRFRERLTTG